MTSADDEIFLNLDPSEEKLDYDEDLVDDDDVLRDDNDHEANADLYDNIIEPDVAENTTEATTTQSSIVHADSTTGQSPVELQKSSQDIVEEGSRRINDKFNRECISSGKVISLKTPFDAKPIPDSLDDVIVKPDPSLVNRAGGFSRGGRGSQIQRGFQQGSRPIRGEAPTVRRVHINPHFRGSVTVDPSIRIAWNPALGPPPMGLRPGEQMRPPPFMPRMGPPPPFALPPPGFRDQPPPQRGLPPQQFGNPAAPPGGMFVLPPPNIRGPPPPLQPPGRFSVPPPTVGAAPPVNLNRPPSSDHRSQQESKKSQDDWEQKTIAFLRQTTQSRDSYVAKNSMSKRKYTDNSRSSSESSSSSDSEDSDTEEERPQKRSFHRDRKPMRKLRSGPLRGPAVSALVEGVDAEYMRKLEEQKKKREAVLKAKAKRRQVTSNASDSATRITVSASRAISSSDKVFGGSSKRAEFKAEKTLTIRKPTELLESAEKVRVRSHGTDGGGRMNDGKKESPRKVLIRPPASQSSGTLSTTDLRFGGGREVSRTSVTGPLQAQYGAANTTPQPQLQYPQNVRVSEVPIDFKFPPNIASVSSGSTVFERMGKHLGGNFVQSQPSPLDTSRPPPPTVVRLAQATTLPPPPQQPHLGMGYSVQAPPPQILAPPAMRPMLVPSAPPNLQVPPPHFR